MATRQNIYNLLSSSATLITPAAVHSGVDITIQNVSSESYVFLGNENVTSTNFGYRINPGAAWSIELSGRDSIHATTDADGTQVAVLMFGLESGS